MFSCQKQYLTRSLRSLVRYRFCHSNIKSISSRNRIISYIYVYIFVDTCIFVTILYVGEESKIFKPYPFDHDFFPPCHYFGGKFNKLIHSFIQLGFTRDVSHITYLFLRYSESCVGLSKFIFEPLRNFAMATGSSSRTP